MNVQKCFQVNTLGDLTLLGIILDLELRVGSRPGRLMRPAIYKVGCKPENPQCIKMTMNAKSPSVCHPTLRIHASSVISISDTNSEAVGESVMEPETDEHYLPENQLGLEENHVHEASVDHLDVASVSEASGKH